MSFSMWGRIWWHPFPFRVSPRDSLIYYVCGMPFFEGESVAFQKCNSNVEVFSGRYQIFICNPSVQNLCKKKNTVDLDSVYSAKIWSFRFQVSFIWADKEVQLPSSESQSQWWYLEASDEYFHKCTPKASLLSDLCSAKMSTRKRYQDRLHG